MIAQDFEWKTDVTRVDYFARDVAYYAVTYGIQNQLKLYNRHIQAILYFSQVTWIVEKGHPCFYDEIKAGKLGPLVDEVQGILCEFYTVPIDDIPLPWKDDMEKFFEERGFKHLVPNKNLKPEDQKQIASIIEKVGTYSKNDLIDLFQQQPLWKAYRQQCENEGKDKMLCYDIQELKNYYEQHPIEIV